MPDKEATDAILAVRCQLGERKAWDELVERWHPRLWRFVVRTIPSGSDADDVLQTVWLRIVRNLVRLREPERLAPWMYSIARMAIADRFRRLYRHPPPDEIGEVAHIDDGIHLVETTEAVAMGLEQLHATDREVVVLHYWEGFSVVEVAEICGVPPGTIKSRLHRARRILRETLVE